MYALITLIHVSVCFVLILIVLLQAGKGANMGAAFGGSSQTVFGSGGAGTFLGKLTAGVAVVFMLTSLTLTYMANHRSTPSLVDQPKMPTAEQTIPAKLPNAAQMPAPVTSPGAAKMPVPVTSPGQAKLPATPTAPVSK